MMLEEEQGISKAKIAVTERGKPVLGEQYANCLDFNITHDGPWVAVAISTQGQIGIDISATVNFQKWEDFARDYLDPHEIGQLRYMSASEAPIAAARFWTAKEAILKAAGYGLEIDPREIILELGPTLLLRQLPDILPPPEFFVIKESEQFHGCCLTISCVFKSKAAPPTMSIREICATDMPCVKSALFPARTRSF